MTTALIIGDGPGGLSAALFLAKNGCDARVFGNDTTANHKALLLNYPGIERITGSDYQKVVRAQATQYGAQVHAANVVRVEKTADGFQLATEDGATHAGKYLVLAAGPKPALAAELGLATDERGFILADRNGVTNVPGVYAVGWSARPDKVQAVISAGDGAAAALDILSQEKGKQFHDFDRP